MKLHSTMAKVDALNFLVYASSHQASSVIEEPLTEEAVESPENLTLLEPPDETGLTATVLVNGFFGVIFVAGTAANLFVMFLIMYLVKAKVVTNIYIFNLAIADLLFAVWLPFVIIRSVYGEWMWGYSLCKLFFVCTTVNQFGSVAFLTALSVDRYVAVCHPHRARQLRTVPKAMAVVVFCWCVVVLMMTPVYMYSTVANIVSQATDVDNESVVYDGELQCMILWPSESGKFNRSSFTIYTGVCSYVIPLAIIWTLYGQVIVTLGRNNISSASRKRRRSGYRKVSIMVLAVLMSYTVCWTPFWILQLAFEVLDEEVKGHFALQYISLAAYCLQSANSALNPILYCLVSGAYGRQFWQTIKEKLEMRRQRSLLKHTFPQACLAEMIGAPKLRLRKTESASRTTDGLPIFDNTFAVTDVWL